MNHRTRKVWTRGLFVIAFSLAIGLTLASPSVARVVRTAEVAKQVYQALPNIPLENQYFNQKLNKVDPNNTLVNRMLRYHAYTKGRPMEVRLDWKLTIADYLGANDVMDPDTYPSRDVLSQNPLEADRAAVNTLSRSMRDQLIDRLLQYTKSAP
jgi:hypothetical protein